MTGRRPDRPVEPQLARWADEFDSIATAVRILVDGLPTARLSWRPAPGKWSITECLDHLVVTARANRVWQSRAITRARERGITGSGPFEFGWLGRKFIAGTGPSPTRPVHHPRIFTPGSDLDPTRTIAEFMKVQDELEDLLASADGLDLGRIRARSAVTPLLRLNLAAWFQATVAHERRHLQQMERVRAHPGFPKS